MKNIPSLLIAVLVLLFAYSANGAQHRVTSDMSLQTILDSANDGDIITLEPGTYTGNFIINHSITLRGDVTLSNDFAGSELPKDQQVIFDAQSQGDALRIKAPHVTIENLYIRHWGDNLTDQNAAIYIEKQATHPLIQNNNLKGRSAGIYVDKSHYGKFLNNVIQGDNSMRPPDRGNGIHLVMVEHAVVSGNEIWHTRDGLYIISSNENQLINNFLHDLRYGVHYMYSYTNVVSDNFTLNTRVGYALMQSKFLTVTNNLAINSNDHGLLLNFITKSTISNNYISGVQQKRTPGAMGSEGKGMFVYNSLFNKITGNWLSDAQIGIHLTAGSEDNEITNNNFINNPIQIKYVSSREQQWNGNHWSNYLGWDNNNDGFGDVPFEPNDGIDKLLWQYPEAKLLMNSPAILTLRWVQREFPILKPPGVKDATPLMDASFIPNTIQADAIKKYNNKYAKINRVLKEKS